MIKKNVKESRLESFFKRKNNTSLKIGLSYMALILIIHALSSATGFLDLAGCASVDACHKMSVRYILMQPMDIQNLFGVIAMHFFHGSWGHLIGNMSTGILVYVFMSMSFSRLNSLRLHIISIITVGLFGFFVANPNSIYLGASGVIVFMMFYSIIRGAFDKDNVVLLGALILYALFGIDSLRTSVPIGGNIAWQVHLGGVIFGSITGALDSYKFKKFISEFSLKRFLDEGREEGVN